jgi:hypothetical protein
MKVSRILLVMLLNYFMFVFTLANGFLLGNWKVNLDHASNKNILYDDTIIRIDNKFVTVESDNGGKIVGDYIICDNRIIISNVKITKIPSITKLPKVMHNYKWIKLIQQQGLNIKINSVNDTYLFLKYECIPYDGDFLLKKID